MSCAEQLLPLSAFLRQPGELATCERACTCEMLVRIVFYKLVDGLARREGPGSSILEGIKHSSGGWKKFKKEARKTNVLKRLRVKR